VAVDDGIGFLVRPRVRVSVGADDGMAVGSGSRLLAGLRVRVSVGTDDDMAEGNGSGLVVGPSVGASLGTEDGVVLGNGSGLTMVSVGTAVSVAVLAISAAAVSAISSAKATSRDKPAGDGLQEDRNTEASTATRAAFFMAIWKIALSDCA